MLDCQKPEIGVLQVFLMAAARHRGTAAGAYPRALRRTVRPQGLFFA